MCKRQKSEAGKEQEMALEEVPGGRQADGCMWDAQRGTGHFLFYLDHEGWGTYLGEGRVQVVTLPVCVQNLILRGMGVA
jgi:hypothetical protein